MAIPVQSNLNYSMPSLLIEFILLLTMSILVLLKYILLKSPPWQPHFQLKLLFL